MLASHYKDRWAYRHRVVTTPADFKGDFMMDEEEIDIENRLAEIFLKRIFGAFLILLAVGLMIAAYFYL